MQAADVGVDKPTVHKINQLSYMHRITVANLWLADRCLQEGLSKHLIGSIIK